MSTLKALLGPIVVAVLVLAGLSGWQDTGFREQIEDELTASSQEALSAAGVAGADVSFVGRDATVEADTTTAAATAGAVVRDVTGVRVVRAVGPDGEVDLDTVASGQADDDGGAGDGVSDADDSDDRGAEAGADDDSDDPSSTDDDSDADDSTGSDSGADDSGSDDSESSNSESGNSESGNSESGDDGSGSGSSDSDSADGDDGSGDDDSGDDDSAESDSDDADREPTKKEKAEAQDDLVEIPNITFVTDSARLTRDGKKVVRQAARVLEDHPDVRVRIEGHTDSRGDEDDNQRLSERRARTVLDRLVDLGVDEDRLSYKGFGESRPLVAPLTFADLEKNRRVEFVVRD